MFWTNWVKGVMKLLLVLMIIGSVVIGLVLMDESDALGFGVMVGGVLISLTSVSAIMMLCEISTNIYELKSQMGTIPAPSSSYSTVGQTSEKPASQSSGSSSASWVCNCGTRNPNSAIFCKSCGKAHEKGTGGSSSKTWRCPKCGKENPSSSRVCKDCAYEK